MGKSSFDRFVCTPHTTHFQNIDEGEYIVCVCVCVKSDNLFCLVLTLCSVWNWGAVDLAACADQNPLFQKVYELEAYQQETNRFSHVIYFEIFVLYI